jgi:hypothetical protein
MTECYPHEKAVEIYAPQVYRENRPNLANPKASLSHQLLP